MLTTAFKKAGVSLLNKAKPTPFRTIAKNIFLNLSYNAENLHKKTFWRDRYEGMRTDQERAAERNAVMDSVIYQLVRFGGGSKEPSHFAHLLKLYASENLSYGVTLEEIIDRIENDFDAVQLDWIKAQSPEDIELMKQSIESGVFTKVLQTYRSGRALDTSALQP